MIKRIIALAAAVLMLIGSTQIPQASNGEPVRQEEQHDRTASVSSENSSSDPGPEEAPESADESARRITDSDRLPDRRVAEHTEESKGAEVDEYKGVLSTVSTDIWAGSSEGGPEEDGAEPSGTDSAPADGAEPEPEGYSEDAAADSWEAEVVPEEPVIEEPEPEPVVEGPQMEYLGDFTISGYCDCSSCCGQWAGGPCADGSYPMEGYTCAMGGLDFGTVLYIDGVGYRTICDRGTDYGWVDLYFDSHDSALAWGLQTRSVWIVR